MPTGSEGLSSRQSFASSRAGDTDADVIVVGAGPSGLTVAGELAMAGAKVLVVERRTGPVESRAGTILPRVLELLDARGLAGQFIERARKIRANPLFQVHIWAGMQPVQWSHLESRFGYRLILPQNVTEELLLAHARALGADVRHGCAVRDIRQGSDGVELDFADADGTARTCSGRYVVGADGARSIVRKAAGVAFEGRDATFTGIVADIELTHPWPEGRRMRDNEMGWVTSFPFGEDIPVTRFNMVHRDRRHAPMDEPVTTEEVRLCLRDIFGEEIAFDRVRWTSRFGDTLRLASRFREGRIMLVGEATRIHYPSSGVGMNFCIQDAFNLGWKLAAVVNGHADEMLLDSFEAERRPVALALLESVKAQCAIQFNFTSEGIAFKRMFQATMMPFPEVNRALALQLNGLSFPYPLPEGSHQLTGERVPDVDLTIAGGKARIGELLREQKFLLIDLTGEDSYRAIDVGRTPVRALSGVPVLVPPSMRGVRSLLVRPDAYVAWADAGPPSIDAARVEIGRWLRIAS